VPQGTRALTTRTVGVPVYRMVSGPPVLPPLISGGKSPEATVQQPYRIVPVSVERHHRPPPN